MSQEIYTITLDDDPMVAKILSKAVGINSLPFTTISGLLSRADRYDPVAAFIDIHLGTEETGLDIIPGLRKLWPFTAIIVITSDSGEDLIGQSLAAGANDFIHKPLKLSEVKARLQVRLREMEIRRNNFCAEIADMMFNRQIRMIKGRDGHSRYLSPTESALFERLLDAKGMIVSKDKLKRAIWGDLHVSNTALDKKIHDVREALKEISKEVEVRSQYGKGIQIVTKAS